MLARFVEKSECCRESAAFVIRRSRPPGIAGGQTQNRCGKEIEEHPRTTNEQDSFT